MKRKWIFAIPIAIALMAILAIGQSSATTALNTGQQVSAVANDISHDGVADDQQAIDTGQSAIPSISAANGVKQASGTTTIDTGQSESEVANPATQTKADGADDTKTPQATQSS